MPLPAQVEQLFAPRKPLVVGAISDSAGFTASPGGCDLIELRVDSFGSSRAVYQFARDCPVPLVITVRGPEEGGQNRWSPEKRAEAYLALLPYAALIDLELRDFDRLDGVLKTARESGTGIIGSFHDFAQTPSLAELTALQDDRADLLKFALMVRSTDDIATHLDFARGLRDQPYSLMGMGPLGAAARPLMAKVGSRLNYGYLGDTPTAPDQWPAGLLAETLAL